MPTPLVLAALLATLEPVVQQPAPSPQVENVDGCAGPASIPEAEGCAAGAPLCSARQRVAVMCELRDAVRERYVFLDQKRALLGDQLQARGLLGACIDAERNIEREDEPLHFYDRLRRCVARLQDGHLLVGTPVRLPQVALGVGFRRAGGKIVVGWRERALAELSGAEVAAALPPGAELLAIDGRPAADAAAHLARSVSASSKEARLERAVEALGRRDFAYPERRTAALTILAGGTPRTVEVPWWVSPGADRHPVAAGWAKRSGIAATDRLAWFEDAVRPRPGAAPDGAPAWMPLFAPPSGLREYVDENGRVAVRFGAIERGSKDVCYLQLLTFHTETLATDGRRRPFEDVVDGLMRECASRELDVVLDLRRNEGGYLDHSTAVAEALAPADAALPAAALVLRATERNEAVYRERAGRASPPASDDALAPGRVLEAIGQARREGRPFTPAFVGAPVRFRSAVGGFSGRVVALTGPACMSACDRLVALLRASGRAILVGGPTEGAGGSQQETPKLAARWTDGSGVLSVSIPNAAFGVPRVAGGAVVAAAAAPAGAALAPANQGLAAAAPAGGALAPGAVAARPREISFETFFDSYAIENRPIEPDVRYEPSVEDVTGGGRGWVEQVDAILFGGPAKGPVT